MWPIIFILAFFFFFNIKFKSYLAIQSIDISIDSFSFLTERCLSGCWHQMKSCIGYQQEKKKSTWNTFLSSPAQRSFAREDALILTYLKISNASCKILKRNSVKKTVNPGGINQIYNKKEETLFLSQIPFFFNSLSAVNLVMAAWFCTHITGDNSYSNLRYVHLLIWWQNLSP